MEQNDNTAPDIGDAIPYAPANADQYLADIAAYRQTIQGILDIFRNPDYHLIDILSDPERLKIYETQIMDVLSYVSRIPIPGGISFTYRANVLQSLSNARLELTRVLFLLGQNPLVAVQGFDFITHFLEYLDLAESMMFVTMEEEE